MTSWKKKKMFESLVIREMQIKVARYCYTHTGVVNMRRTNSTKFW